MRKLLLFLLTVSMAAYADHVTYFSCDFNSGLPEGTQTADLDGQTLHFTMTQAGFNQGDAWRVLTTEGRTFAAAPGRYKKVTGTELRAADKWMILPSACILSEDAMLRWQATTIAESLEQGASYEVRVSTVGNRPEDFTDAPLAAIEAESLSEWTMHEVSLKAYAGKRVWVAFRCTSLNSEILGIDDVVMDGGSGSYLLASTTPTIHITTAPLLLSAQLKPTSASAIHALTAYCTTPSGIQQKHYEGLNLKQGDTPLNITFDSPITLEPGDTLHYSFRVEVEGNSIEQPDVEACTQALLFPTQRRTVVEEGTGMWCTYCPRGIVAMQRMAERYPDTFIGIAVHYDDELGNIGNLPSYCNALDFPVFPSARVNRHIMCGELLPKDADGQFTTLNGGIESIFLDEQSRPAPANFEVACRTTDNGKLEVRFFTHFAVNRDKADYRLTAIAVEDDVTARSYYQQNYYSGYDTPIDGFESLPQRIQPYTFQEVARAQLLPFEGKRDTFYPTLQAGTTSVSLLQFDMPTHLDLNNLRVVGMLIDTNQGTVVNAAQSAILSSEQYDEKIAAVGVPHTAPVLPAATYDIAGRRTDHISMPGLYITDGRKHIYRHQ